MDDEIPVTKVLAVLRLGKTSAPLQKGGSGSGDVPAATALLSPSRGGGVTEMDSARGRPQVGEMFEAEAGDRGSVPFPRREHVRLVQVPQTLRVPIHVALAVSSWSLEGLCVPLDPRERGPP